MILRVSIDKRNASMRFVTRHSLVRAKGEVFVLLYVYSSVFTGRPARSAAMPVPYCFYSLAQKWVFRPAGANVHVYRGRNVGIQPPKLSKCRIFARNLYLRGDSFAILLRNSQHFYTSKGDF